MYLKNVELTSKSQILKFMIQQKGFNKKAAEGYAEMFKIFFIPTKNHF